MGSCEANRERHWEDEPKSRNLISAALIRAAVLFGTTAATKQDTTTTIALGINAEGDIVGYYKMAGVRHSYVLSEGTLTTIDPPFGISGPSQAQGINLEGDVMGLYADDGTIGEVKDDGRINVVYRRRRPLFGIDIDYETAPVMA